MEVANPAYLFEPLRVDITSAGKMRARKVNLLQPTKLQTVQYPLEFRERAKASYFQQREQWRLTDFLFNPMVFNMCVCVCVCVCVCEVMAVCFKILTLYCCSPITASTVILVLVVVVYIICV